MKLARPTGPKTFAPKLAKPIGAYCEGCPLEHPGHGYVPGDGQKSSPIVLVGEGPWFDEVAQGFPMAGASGAMLTRILRILGKQREDVQVDNCIRCAVPSGSLDKWPEPERILAQCRYVDETLANPAVKVIVPLGGIALRRLLGLPKSHKVRVQDFHGTVQQDQLGRWVVPTYHPAHLVRGAMNLTNVVAFDLGRAWEVASGTYRADVEDLVLDPPIDWFRAWADQYLAAIAHDPYAYPLAVDIETPEGTQAKGETLTAAADDSYTITRINLSCHPEEGVTVPPTPEHLAIVFELLAAAQVQYYWFKGYDYPRLRAAGATHSTLQCLDLMWAWKALQADLPMGLGHAAPFYVKGAAWKHLSHERPAWYGAVDGVRTRKVGDGILRDLTSQGRANVFYRHQHAFHAYVLQPATDVGVAIDRDRLAAFHTKLDTAARANLQIVQQHIPAEARVLTPKGGMTKPPMFAHPASRAETVKGVAKKEAPDPIKAEVYALATVEEKLQLIKARVCRTCGKQQVLANHRCQLTLPGITRDSRPILEEDVISVSRWFWVEPFNPDSPPQLLALGKLLKLEPGKDKKTRNDSVGREVLQRWAKELRESKDPKRRDVAVAIGAMLDFKSIAKVRGTYVIGMTKRLDADDRVHPETTFKPNTMRTSQVNPNLQNVVADKGGKESIAAGFRGCVVARGREVEVGSEYADVVQDYQRIVAPAVWGSTKLLEFDFAAIEAVIQGWCMRSRQHVRMAKLGIHGFVASHALHRPVSLDQPDADIAAQLYAIKKSTDAIIEAAYVSSKRTVHAVSYGQTAMGTYLSNPTLFKTLKDAERVREIYFAVTPDLPGFQKAVQHTAYTQGYLGGAGEYAYDQEKAKVTGHPYQYQLWLFSVIQYERLNPSQVLWRKKRGMPVEAINGISYGVKLGEDAKRACAYYGQSIARGVLTEAAFPLFDPEDPLADRCYIGDLYYGDTPLRAPIHDSFLFECPTRKVDRLIERVAYAMQRPVDALPLPADWGMGTHLTIGVDAKMGDDWGAMTSVRLPSWAEIGVAGDSQATPSLDEDDGMEEEAEDWATPLRVGA